MKKYLKIIGTLLMIVGLFVLWAVCFTALMNRIESDFARKVSAQICIDKHRDLYDSCYAHPTQACYEEYSRLVDACVRQLR